MRVIYILICTFLFLKCHLLVAWDLLLNKVVLCFVLVWLVYWIIESVAHRRAMKEDSKMLTLIGH